MKTLCCTRPGELEYFESDRPSPKEGDTLLRIRRIGICGTDLHAFEGTQPFFEYPRVLGHELAAEIEETSLPGFTKGEAVTLVPYFHCGKCIACRNQKPNCCVNIKVCGVHIDGGMTEYLPVPSYSIVRGEGLTLDELATVEPLAIGLHAVRRAAVTAGEFVLVVGAGPIGLAVMAFAQQQGATVVAMDVNEYRLNFCKERLGIPYLINVSMGDANEKLRAITGGEMASVVFDATGNRKAINDGLQYLSHGGRYVLVGLQKEMFSFSHPEFHKRETMLMSSRNATQQDFRDVIGSIKKKAIDPLELITHRTGFDELKNKFASWLDPAGNVVKAMVAV